MSTFNGVKTDSDGNLQIHVNSDGGAGSSSTTIVDATHSDRGLSVNVDGSINIGTLPATSPTATKQDVGNTSVASIDVKTPALGQANMANSSPVTVASNQTAIPVSGTVTANIGSTASLALDASLSTIDSDIKAAQPRKMQDGAGNALTSVSLNSGSTRAIDMALRNSSGAQVDPTQVRALTSSDQVTVANPSLSVSQNGTWNINNVAGTVSLPTGAATGTKQDTGNTSLASVDSKTPALGQAGMASSTPVVIASNQTAIPISGTVTANIGSTDGIALDSTLTTIDTDIKASQPRKMQDGVGNALTSVSLAGNAIRAIDIAIRNSSGTQVDPTQVRALTSSDQITVANPSLPVTQSGNWNINNISGSVSLPSNAAQETGGNLATIATNTLNTNISAQNTQGSVLAGTAASKSNLGGGQYNSTLPTLTTGQQAAQQLDSNGRLITTSNSIAADGASLPSVTAVGGTDGTNLQALSTDTQGRLNINQASLDILEQILTEIQMMRLAIVTIACENGQRNDKDFDPNYMKVN